MKTSPKKRNLWIASVSMMITLLISFGTLEARPGNSFGDGLDKNRDEVVELFRDRTGTKIKGVLWADHDDLLVGIVKDGTPHGEVAKIMCTLIADYGFGGKGVTVHIIDFYQLLETKRGLGVSGNR